MNTQQAIHSGIPVPPVDPQGQAAQLFTSHNPPKRNTIFPDEYATTQQTICGAWSGALFRGMMKTEEGRNLFRALAAKQAGGGI